MFKIYIQYCKIYINFTISFGGKNSESPKKTFSVEKMSSIFSSSK